jgi:hypothetical protein
VVTATRKKWLVFRQVGVEKYLQHDIATNRGESALSTEATEACHGMEDMDWAMYKQVVGECSEAEFPE